jgi:hypothetical protein
MTFDDELVQLYAFIHKCRSVARKHSPIRVCACVHDSFPLLLYYSWYYRPFNGCFGDFCSKSDNSFTPSHSQYLRPVQPPRSTMTLLQRTANRSEWMPSSFSLVRLVCSFIDSLILSLSSFIPSFFSSILLTILSNRNQGQTQGSRAQSDSTAPSSTG